MAATRLQPLARALHPDDLVRAQDDFRRAVETRRQLPFGIPPAPQRMARCAISARSARSTRTPASRTKIVGVNWDVTADVALNEKPEARQPADRGAQRRTGSRQGAHRVQRAARFADRPAQPPLSRRDAGSAMSSGRRARANVRGAAPYRSRPLQADQRHARPCRRRRHADACREGAEVQPARRRFRRAHRRRRVRGRLSGDQTDETPGTRAWPALADRIIERDAPAGALRGPRVPLRRHDRHCQRHWMPSPIRSAC